MPLIEHAAKGDPCATCDEPARRHRKPRARIWHASKGNPCKVCGESASSHPGRKRLKARRAYDAGRNDRRAARRIVAVDGEGVDKPDGRHLYVYLAAVDEYGKLVAEARNPKGLTHDECVTALLRIPRNTLKFGFSFGNYDVTKICESLPVEDRYRLLRPEARRRFTCIKCNCRWSLASFKRCPRCKSTSVRSYNASIRYRGRRYGFLRGNFTISDDSRRCHVWDAHRFFRSSFIDALDDLGVGSVEERTLIRRMKERREEFANVPAEQIEAYCQLECRLLAQMMRKVLGSCSRVGLPLARYDGAGSVAAAMLKRHRVDRYRGPDLGRLDDELADAIMRAYVGGRFEHRIVGRFDRLVHNHDVSSAYAAGLVDQPCLKCGRWRRVTGRGLMRAIEKSDLACVRFEVASRSLDERHKIPWCPLPCRDESGSLVFGTGFSGWAWKPEALAALRGWPDLVKLTAAWIYTTDCDHRPFAFMRDVYRERLRLGKDAAGKILKLALAASWGKTAQGVGSARYRSYIWSGSGTAHTRAQMLGPLARFGSDVLAVATDGLVATRDLGLKSSGLGGWTHKAAPDGILLVRPGLFFRLSDAAADPKHRGMSKRGLVAAAPDLLAAWERWDRSGDPLSVTIRERRFFGAKQSIVAMSRCRCGASWPGVPELGCPSCGKLGAGFRAGEIREGAYGRWADVDLTVSFDPHPKRERALRRGGSWSPLVVRDLGGIESRPYTPGRTTPEAEGSRDRRDDVD